MENISKTIDALRKIIKDKNCKRMNLSNVKGYLGELIIFQKLQEEGMKVEQRGNQSGYDIEMPEKNIKIDVKFSILNNQFKHLPNFWGWALKQNNQKKVSCTHFILVAVDNDSLLPKNFYIINAKHLSRFPESGISQFKNVKHGFVYLERQDSINKILDKKINQYFLKSRHAIKKGYVIRTPVNSVLSKYLLQ